METAFSRVPPFFRYAVTPVARVTQHYDRRAEEITLDEVERVGNSLHLPNDLMS